MVDTLDKHKRKITEKINYTLATFLVYEPYERSCIQCTSCLESKESILGRRFTNGEKEAVFKST